MNSKLFTKHIKSSRGKVSLSALLIISVLVFTGTIFMVRHNTANAAAITSVSDTLNNSAPGATSTHTISFTTPTGIAADATMTITFPSSFTTGTLDFTDIDLTDDGGDVSFADTPSGTTWGATTTGVDSGFTLTNGSAAVAGGSAIVIEIGDNATNQTTGDAHFTNPAKSADVGTADIYIITIAGGFGDSGNMLIAIIESVTVSVTVAESLTFTIGAQAPGDCADYDNTSGTEITTTTTTVPFGTPSTEAFIDGCHALTVGTNASAGYVLTVQEDDQLTSGGDQITDGNCDGSCSDSAEADWATPGNNGFAYCMEDTTGDGASTADTGWGTNGCDDSDTFFKTFADTGESETPQNIMSSPGVASSDAADIGYRLSVDSAQAAGTYTNTLTFIATPTF